MSVCSRSVRHAIREEYGQLCVDHAPVLPSASPFLRNIHHGKIQHFQQAVIRGKHGFCLGHLPKLAVKALDGIGCIDQAANLLGVLEIGAEIRPVVPPRLRDSGVFLVPALGKSAQSVQCRGLIHRGVDRLQICHERLYVLVGYIFAGIPELMDDAVLNLCLGEHCFNRCGKPGQIIRASDENILNIPVFQAIEYRCPEFGALIFTDPHTQNVLLAVRIDTNGNIDSLLDDLSLAAHMVVDGIEKNDRVDGLQRPLLPFFCDGQDLICNAAYGCIAYAAPKVQLDRG